MQIVELTFMQNVIMYSHAAIINDYIWTEERQEFEMVLDNLLEELELIDCYDHYPFIIQTFQHGEKFIKLMFPKVQKFVEDCKRNNKTLVSNQIALFMVR